jgi:hypothetical protein
MVTHSSTSRPVQCLCMAERTGCPVLTDLWSYVSVSSLYKIYSLRFMVKVKELIRTCFAARLRYNWLGGLPQIQGQGWGRAKSTVHDFHEKTSQ